MEAAKKPRRNEERPDTSTWLMRTVFVRAVAKRYEEVNVVRACRPAARSVNRTGPGNKQLTVVIAVVVVANRISVAPPLLLLLFIIIDILLTPRVLFYWTWHWNFVAAAHTKKISTFPKLLLQQWKWKRSLYCKCEWNAGI